MQENVENIERIWNENENENENQNENEKGMRIKIEMRKAIRGM